jgi:class 3 adenylate cyclase
VGWDYQRSLDRAKRKWDETDGLIVTPLVRETDFDKIALKQPRLVKGAHFYVGIHNFKALLGVEETDEEMLRLFHLWAREVTRIIETDFDAVKIHFQGPRVHGVAYRPICDQAAVAATAVLAAAAVRDATKLYNEVHGLNEERWATAAGVDTGEAVATRSGVAGDRELLFLGKPANYAAKIISSGLRLTADVADLLPEDVAEHLRDLGDGSYRFSATRAELASLAATHGADWTPARSLQRLTDDAANIPAGSAKVADACSPIDKGSLSLTNSKRAHGASLFADVDGFTGYVADEQAADRLDEAVRAWHVIRAETRETLVTDYDGLRIQYQGDRIQGLVYLPTDDPATVALTAIRTAAALTSVADQVLPQVIGGAALPVAIGMAAGTTMVSRLGEYGDRDTVCLAPATAEAARIQEALSGGQIGIDAELRDALPGWLAEMFSWDPAARAYVTEGLTADELDRLESSENGGVGKALLAAAGLTAVGVGIAALNRRRDREPPLRPYAP